MNSDIKQLEGLSPEDRHRILAETEQKYKSIIKELQDITEYIDHLVNKSINVKDKDIDSYIRSLLSIIHMQSKLLTDIRLVLNKIYNEHSVELHYILINLEILNQNISIIYDKISKLKP